MLGGIYYLMYNTRTQSSYQKSSWINLTLSDKTISTYANLRLYNTACTILLDVKSIRYTETKAQGGNQNISHIFTISQTLCIMA